MSKYSLVSDHPMTPMESFMLQALEDMGEMGIESMAIIALPKSGDFTASFYGNMGLIEKQIAAQQIQADIVHDVVKANFDRYMEAYENPKEDDE